jgi:hypothetical protein
MRPGEAKHHGAAEAETDTLKPSGVGRGRKAAQRNEALAHSHNPAGGRALIRQGRRRLKLGSRRTHSMSMRLCPHGSSKRQDTNPGMTSSEGWVLIR